MAKLKVSILGPKWTKIGGGGFAPQICYGAHMNTPIEDKLLQDISRAVAKFRENRPRNDEKSLDGEKKFKKLTRCYGLYACVVRKQALSRVKILL